MGFGGVRSFAFSAPGIICFRVLSPDRLTLVSSSVWFELRGCRRSRSTGYATVRHHGFGGRCGVEDGAGDAGSLLGPSHCRYLSGGVDRVDTSCSRVDRSDAVLGGHP